MENQMSFDNGVKLIDAHTMQLLIRIIPASSLVDVIANCIVMCLTALAAGTPSAAMMVIPGQEQTLPYHLPLEPRDKWGLN